MTRAIALALFAVVLALTTSCGSDDEPDNDVGRLAEEVSEATGGDGGEYVGEDACALLTDAEVAAAIGEHHPAEHDPLFGGCLWQSIALDGTGDPSSVRAAVLSPDVYEAVADPGEPIAGFGGGAHYADLQGQLWFPCPGGRFCGIKLDSPDADTRLQQAITLAEALAGRVK